MIFKVSFNTNHSVILWRDSWHSLAPKVSFCEAYLLAISFLLLWNPIIITPASQIWMIYTKSFKATNAKRKKKKSSWKHERAIMWMLFPASQKGPVVIRIGMVGRGSSLESISHCSTNALGLQQEGDTLEDSKSSWQDDPAWLQLSEFKEQQAQSSALVECQGPSGQELRSIFKAQCPAGATPACPPSSFRWRPLVQC